MIKVARIVVGAIMENCYIVSEDIDCTDTVNVGETVANAPVYADNASEKMGIGLGMGVVSTAIDAAPAVLIDPGDHPRKIMSELTKLNLRPTAILLTHGHFDHIGAVNELRANFPDITVYAYIKEKALLEDDELNESRSMRRPVSLSNVTYLEDGAVLHLINNDFKLIATPGHTAGSVCYYVEDSKALFAGDTLFSASYGRTDLATGSERDIIHSIRDILMALPDDTLVLPGHGEMTSIGTERQINPIMRGGY